MLQQFIFGLLLGWGAAIPLGPMNLEIIRRNLHFGTFYGIALGVGACSADVTYLVLLSLGALTILTYPLALQIIGILGSCILLWFGFSALRLKSSSLEKRLQPESSKNAHYRHAAEGYFLTLVNPYTVIFWASVSTEIAIMSKNSSHAALYAGLGVLFGTLSWVAFLNASLHLTRHRLPPRAMVWLNRIGGLLLIGFALLGFWHSLP